MKKYFTSIQVLRGLLFLFILAFHSGAPYANFGWGGVESFFVISAFFLVLNKNIDARIDVKKRFKHRITRLYPPYIVVVLVAALYALLISKLPYDIIPHFLSAQNYMWMLTEYKSPMQPMTAHTWTLSIEVWCGLVWLLILRYLPQKFFKHCMYAMLLVGILYRTATIVAGANVYVVSLCPLAHFDAFACGSLLAVGLKEQKFNSRISLLSVLGLVGIFSCIAFLAHHNQVNFVHGYQLLSSSKNYLNGWFTGNLYFYITLLTTGLVGFLYLHDINKREDAVGLIKKIFVILGNYSYELYLFHWPVLQVVKFFNNTWPVKLIVTFVVTIFAALLFKRGFALYQKKLLGGNSNGSSV